MDFNQIAKLLPEFLQNFTGENSSNLPGILSAISDSQVLEGFIGEKYSKYLPLLPLLAKLSTEGFKGLLADADTISTVLSAVTSGNNSPEIFKGLKLDALLPLLPMFFSLFKKDGDGGTPSLQALLGGKTGTQDTANADNKPHGASADIARSEPIQETVYYQNPLAPISAFADRDIVYMLNRYISSQTTV